jgi:hypothetical protein
MIYSFNLFIDFINFVSYYFHLATHTINTVLNRTRDEASRLSEATSTQMYFQPAVLAVFVILLSPFVRMLK